MWNTQGEMIIEPVFSYISLIDSELSFIIDQEGMYIYDYISRQRISEKYDWIVLTDWIAQTANDVFFICGDNRSESMGILDHEGRTLINCDYAESYIYDNKIVRLVYHDSYNIHYFSLDDSNPLDITVHTGSDYNDGYAAVGSEDGIYMIDEYGMVVSPVFTEISDSFGEGYFAGKANDSWYIYRIVSKESTCVEGPLDTADMPWYIGDSCFCYRFQDGVAIYNTAKNETGFLPEAEITTVYVGDAAIIYDHKGEENGYLFRNGQSIRNHYEQASWFLGDYAFVRRYNTWYAINRDGNIIENVNYDALRVYITDGQYFRLEWDDRTLFLDKYLNEITALNFVIYDD